MYVMNALAFLWIRIFMQLWGLDKSSATLSLLLIPMGGTVLGFVTGSRIDMENGTRALKEVVNWILLAMLSAVCAAIGMCLQVAYKEIWTFSFCLTSVGLATIFLGVVTAQGALTSACTEAVKEDSLRSFAVGLQQCLLNLIGLACGPLLSGLAMSLAGLFGVRGPASVCVGGLCALSGSVLYYCCARLAWVSSSRVSRGEPLLAS